MSKSLFLCEPLDRCHCRQQILNLDWTQLNDSLWFIGCVSNWADSTHLPKLPSKWSTSILLPNSTPAKFGRLKSFFKPLPLPGSASKDCQIRIHLVVSWPLRKSTLKPRLEAQLIWRTWTWCRAFHLTFSSKKNKKTTISCTPPKTNPLPFSQTASAIIIIHHPEPMGSMGINMPLMTLRDPWDSIRSSFRIFSTASRKGFAVNDGLFTLQ